MLIIQLAVCLFTEFSYFIDLFYRVYYFITLSVMANLIVSVCTPHHIHI